MGRTIPMPLSSHAATPAGAEWLASLPATIDDVARRWRLDLGEPFHDASAAWVAPARTADGEDVVLKITFPHMEAAHEADGLRALAGDPTVHLIDHDPTTHALLLERCRPGTNLKALDEDEQDVVIAELLRRLWRPVGEPFRPLTDMADLWMRETRAGERHWPDRVLVEEGLRAFAELSRPGPSDVLLATDLHAGNVLRAQRRPWLVIDVKPFIGDAAYDATQHLLNCLPRVRRDPGGCVARFADLLGVDAQRVGLWMFARLAAEPREHWDAEALEVARALAPR